MKTFHIRRLSEVDQDIVSHFLVEHWGSTKMVSRGRVHITDALPGFIALMGADPVALLVYSIRDGECEIVLLHTLVERIGIAVALLAAVTRVAKGASCRRLWLITTNDNTKALRFYQRNNFHLVAVYPDAVEESRRLKPEIPRTGADGIPIRDELELELLL